MLNCRQLNSTVAVVSVLGVATTVTSMLPAQAAQIIYSSSGDVSGINGLIVDGISYEVSFQFDTFTNVFGTPNSSNFDEPTFWGNQQAAQTAANSIVSLLNSQEPIPRRINSISSVLIPYRSIIASNKSTFITNKIGNFIRFRWDNYRGNSQDIEVLDFGKQNYAVFRPIVAQTSVTEPGVLLGLVGSVSFLGLSHWRKQLFQ
ncbi:hypothetical protein [Anabaena azotica]|uniref:PEP-CTERM sorting domain-containing protein n=1 Tax=Anabaena azotica FACHB-119 TaxID=947527 RepID=A0ABR8D309_9NOST|nr:hypothetical protein [Anabaena azotica]MBD2501525.1 hypothetical protein [Anabaena azotica FACHB-119]